MRKRIFLSGNSVTISPEGSEESSYIGVQFFSFETASDSVQLIDSSKDQEVISIQSANCLLEDGQPIGDLSQIVTYLQSFSAPLGSVSIEAGSKVQIVDSSLGDVVVGEGETMSTNKGFFLLGEDAQGTSRRLRTETDGRLISSASVVNPPNSTLIVQTFQDVVSNSVDNDYLIPNGEDIVVQQFYGGAEGDVDGSKVELYVFDDSGKTTGQLVAVVYVNGSNGSDSINQSFTGDGSRIITIRRSRLSGQGKEIFGKWLGYKF